MDGFRVFSEPIKVSKNKVGQFNVLIEDSALEIVEIKVNEGKSFICQPSECTGAINVVFVISGKLHDHETERFIVAGERFSYKDLSTSRVLSVIEPSTLLIFRPGHLTSQQLPTIEVISDFLHQIQAKDSYTENHCNSTGNLAARIASQMRQPDQVVANVLFAGKIHDVGKIATPESILNKPGSLEPFEYDIVKRHPTDGHDIVLRETVNAAYARIVLEHHEKVDGSGYPYGLTGDQICMEAKIICVADSYDAMTSDRPYRKARSHEYAIEELKRYAGIWYDSEVVSALCALMDKK